MTDTEISSNTPVPPKKRRKSWAKTLLGGVVYLCVGLCVFLGVAVIALQDQTIKAPDSQRDRLAALVNDAIAPATAHIGDIEFGLFDGLSAKAQLRDVLIRGEGGQSLAFFAAVETEFSLSALISQDVGPRQLNIRGVKGHVARDANGVWDIGFDVAQDQASSFSVSQSVEFANSISKLPRMGRLKKLSVTDATIAFADGVNVENHIFENGAFDLELDGQTNIQGKLRWALPDDIPADVIIGYRAEGPQDAAFSIGVSDVPATHLWREFSMAETVGVLAGLVDANLSGTIVEGEVSQADAVFTGTDLLFAKQVGDMLGKTAAKIYAKITPKQKRMMLESVEITSPNLQISASGHVLGGERLVAQITQADVQLAEGHTLGADVVPKVTLSGDLMFEPKTRRLTVGQATVQTGAVSADVRSKLEFKDGVPIGTGHLRSAKVGIRDIVNIWPATLKPKLHSWFASNAKAGDISDLSVSVRFGEDGRVTPYASFGFSDAQVRFMRHMPDLVNAQGYGTWENNRLALILEQARVPADVGPNVAIGESLMVVEDTSLRPATGNFTVRGSGQIASVLSLLDRKPLQIMTKADRPVNLASGDLSFEARITTALRKGVPPDQIKSNVVATARNVSSTKIIPGRELRAKSIEIRAKNGDVEIGGNASLDGVALAGTWTKKAGSKTSAVAAKIPLSQNALRTFGINLPKGTLTGQGRGTLALTLAKNTAPKFTLTSDLSGLGVKIPSVGWRKSANRSGKLSLTGALGQTPSVDKFSFSASGLKAAGSLTLVGNGKLQEARFSQLQVGDWLNTKARMKWPSGKGLPAITLDGGTLDMSRMPKLGSGGGSGSAIAANLDRLRITDKLTLRNAAVSLPASRAKAGKFSGRVNGGARIQGVLNRTNSGTAITVRSNNAGAALRDAGLLDRADEGSLLLQLNTTPGGFSGSARIQNIRVTRAPAIASLISAISVVGLLEQMDGKGLLFTDVHSDFHIKDGLLTVQKASAIGPSLGVSVDGFINTRKGALDMQGVLSPFYLVNGLGAIFTRRGEGLIGFNFNLRGSAKSPSVSVNPLSVFTPGMFREIFRRAPPEPSQ